MIQLTDKRLETINDMLFSQKIVDGKVVWCANEDPNRTILGIKNFCNSVYAHDKKEVTLLFDPVYHLVSSDDKNPGWYFTNHLGDEYGPFASEWQARGEFNRTYLFLNINWEIV